MAAAQELARKRSGRRPLLSDDEQPSCAFTPIFTTGIISTMIIYIPK